MEDTSFVSGIVVYCRCHRESRPQEGDGIAQAWATCPKGASAPKGTRDGDTGNKDDSSIACFLNLTIMPSDKFKMIIALNQAQKYGDREPYKNLVFSYN